MEVIWLRRCTVIPFLPIVERGIFKILAKASERLKYMQKRERERIGNYSPTIICKKFLLM